MAKYIVFGASGFIGNHIYSSLKRDEINVLGISRDGRYDLKFDIMSDDIEKFISRLELNNETIVLWALAETRIDVCLEKYDYAYELNVIKTKLALDLIINYGANLIFFSSDNVFDGEFGNYTEESITRPINKYGEMKVEMEKYLLANYPKVTIYRLPKVVALYPRSKNVFTSWIEQYKTKGEIPCIKDNIINFVCVEDVYNACLFPAEQNMSGLYNICSDKAYKRAHLVKLFFDTIGEFNINIREYPLKHFNLKDKRPLNLSMRNNKFYNLTGYKFMSMKDAAKKYALSIG